MGRRRGRGLGAGVRSASARAGEDIRPGPFRGAPVGRRPGPGNPRAGRRVTCVTERTSPFRYLHGGPMARTKSRGEAPEDPRRRGSRVRPPGVRRGADRRDRGRSGSRQGDALSPLPDEGSALRRHAPARVRRAGRRTEAAAAGGRGVDRATLLSSVGRWCGPSGRATPCSTRCMASAGAPGPFAGSSALAGTACTGCSRRCSGKGSDSGELRAHDPFVSAQLFLGMVRSAVVFRRPGDTIDGLAQEILAVFLRGVGTKEAP